MGFLERLELEIHAKYSSTPTQRMLLSVAKQLVQVCGEKEVYDREDLVRFRAWKNEQGAKKSTIYSYYSYLRMIWLAMQWNWPLIDDGPNRERPPKKFKHYQPWYNIKETTALLNSADKAVKVKGRYEEFLKLRNKLLVRLDAVTVLRVGEVANLNADNYQKPYLVITSPEKDSQYTERLLDVETLALMDAYLKARSRIKHPALFVTHKGKKAERISTRALSDILLKIREEAGIKKPRGGWHAFRRGGMTITHKRTGMSAKAISIYTGISEDVVNRYIQLDTTDAKQLWEKSHPFFDKGAAVAEEVAAEPSNPEEIAEAIGAALDNRPSKYIRDERGRIVRPSGATP